MKNAKREMKRKGFTLVELLIVIVVIGVLSAMMMLSSTEAVSSAKAADIVSDLRNLKTAALAWYADNLDYVSGITNKRSNGTEVSGGFTNLNDEKDYIWKYMNNEPDNKDKYSFGGDKNEKTWHVWYNNSNNNNGANDSKVGAKLKARASSVGLVEANSGVNATQSKAITGDTVVVGLFIR